MNDALAQSPTPGKASSVQDEAAAEDSDASSGPDGGSDAEADAVANGAESGDAEPGAGDEKGLEKAAANGVEQDASDAQSPAENEPELKSPGEGGEAGQGLSEDERQPASDEIGAEAKDSQTDQELLDAPKHNDQELAPYLREPPARQPLRNLEVGPHAGVAWRRSADSAVSYEPGPAIGASVRINLTHWLGVRAYVTHSWHPVSASPESLGIQAGELNQPALEVTLLALRLEPSYWITEQVRVFAAVGAGWGRVQAEAMTTTGGVELERGARFGATSEIGGAIGGSFDVIEDWLTLTASVEGAASLESTGEVFSPRRAFTASGDAVSVEGLPDFAGFASAWLGAQLLL